MTSTLDLPAAFSSRLGDAMTARGMSGYRLAKLVGVTPQTVSNWRNHRAEPKVSTLPTLCLVLGVQPQWLVGMSAAGGPNPPHKPGQGRRRQGRYGTLAAA